MPYCIIELKQHLAMTELLPEYWSQGKTSFLAEAGVGAKFLSKQLQHPGYYINTFADN